MRPFNTPSGDEEWLTHQNISAGNRFEPPQAHFVEHFFNIGQRLWLQILFKPELFYTVFSQLLILMLSMYL